MKCRTLNRRGNTTRWWHRLWCRDCRNAQEIDAMIGFGLMQMQDEPTFRQGITNTLAALDMQTDGPDLQTGGRYLRRAARRVGAYRALRAANIGAVCLLGMGVWWQYMNYTPALNIPTTTLPTPNAFYFFRAAGEKNVYTREVSDASAKPAKDARPGPPTDYIETADGPDGPTAPRIKIHRIFHDKHLYTLKDKQLLLDKNQDVLANVRAGLKYTYAEPYSRTFDAKFPYYSGFRATARLLALDAQVKRETGDWNGAMQANLDSMEMGAKIPGHAPLIGQLVGIACEAIGRKEAWKCVEHLNFAQTRAAIARLQTIQAEHVPYADTMQEEEWFMLESLSKEMHKPNWRLNFFGMAMGVQQPDWRGLMFLGWSNRVMLNDIKTYDDEVIRRSRLPYAQSHALPPIAEPSDPLAQIILPIFEQAHFKHVYDSETQNAFLLTVLALHAYALDHDGKYPETLTEIAPDYLAQVPADPFALNAPLRYVNTNSIRIHLARSVTGWDAVRQTLTVAPNKAMLPGKGQYLLYSVGPDGTDDGGLAVDALLSTNQRAIDAPKMLPDSPQRFQVNSDSKGDIVAGVNMR
jgi:hypothetical protein